MKTNLTLKHYIRLLQLYSMIGAELDSISFFVRVLYSSLKVFIHFATWCDLDLDPSFTKIKSARALISI